MSATVMSRRDGMVRVAVVMIALRWGIEVALLAAYADERAAVG